MVPTPLHKPLLKRPWLRTCAAAAFCLAAQAALAQHAHDAACGPAGDHPATFVASTAKPFGALMEDAMAVMSGAMQHAPMNGMTEHDFIVMMIPHHQGAIDMAKALLLYTRDPAMRNLAQGVITEQQNEIRLMQLWLQQHPAGAFDATTAPRPDLSPSDTTPKRP